MTRKLSLFTHILFITIIGQLSLADDNCCRKLKDSDYKLYGTKTLYETARRFISKDDDLPKTFDDDTLEEEHNDLIRDNCKPTVFYFIGRHAARFPDGEDIELYNKKMGDLQNILKTKSSMSSCPEKMNLFSNWTSRMYPQLDNLMTEVGAREERDIARRFKKLYPEFFDTKTADVKIGVTSKIRTAQTGAEFLSEVKNLGIPQCDAALLPTNDIQKAEYNIDKILQHDCYKILMQNHQAKFLEFHKQCDKINGGANKRKDPRVKDLKSPALLQDVIMRVSRKLCIPPDSIDTDMLDVLFEECKFETAYKEYSIWCSVFEKKDIQLIEYIKDIDIYISNAYGPYANSRQACPVVKDLVENMQNGLNLRGSGDEKRKSYFYFSHAGPMKKILAAFDMFKDSDSYTERRIDELIRQHKVDKDREWQSSVIVPFSANVAFILYRCEKSDGEIKHKILATVTERPVKIGRCKETKCKSTKFFDAYNSMKNCDLNEICKTQTV